MKSIGGGENYNEKLERFLNQAYNFRQLMTKNTTDYHSKLDLVFTNHTPSANIDLVDVIDNYWSDHKIVYTALSYL